MLKSLFSKIFITQIIVALLTIVLVIPMVMYLIGDYFVDSQTDDILKDAMRISTMTENLIDVNGSEEMWKYYSLGIEYSSQQSVIVVLNAEGKVLAASKNSRNINLDRIDEKFIEPAKNGKTSVRLYGQGKIFNEQTLVALAPIMRKDKISGEKDFVGVTVAIRSMPQIKYIQRRIIKIISFAQFAACLLAFIVSYIFTGHITKPIKKMRTAAKKIAAGNFKERIPITSNDEIGQLAKTFNYMTESLNELENMRSSFISDVSHELRTPMTIISGFIEGIIDGTIPKDEEGKYLGIVLNETKRLSRLVNELLEASRIEQGKIPLNKTDFDMNRLVTESVIAYEQRLSEKNIDVTLEFEDDVCSANADIDAIKRVLINLIDNAIKFTPENGKITLRTQCCDKKVITSVENTGEGIPENELKHIWERFYKTDKSRSMDKKGIGLGLHIVKMIVSQHGGEISAESIQGEITKFIFSLDKGSKSGVIYENRKDEK